MDKEKKKLWRRWLGWIFLRFSILFHDVFPLGWSYFLGALLGSLAYFLLFPHRRIALESLSIAFPKLSLRKRQKIARAFFIFIAQSSFELVYFLKHPPALKNIQIEGRRYLEEALKEKRGVILVTAHLGSFPLLSVKLVKEGYPVNFVTRPMRDQKTGEYLYHLRTQAGIKTIFSLPRRQCLLEIIQALRNNELVILQMDQNFGSGGVWVKFFNKLAATPTGAVTLALKTQAKIVPVYICRQSRGRHTIHILPAQELVVTPNADETILLNTINLSRLIESWISRYPEQWGWFHRRWKSQPSSKMERLPFRIEK